MVRRSIAAGAGLLVLVLLLFGLKGCLDSRKEGAFEDYVREVSALVGESNQQSDALFALFTDSAGASEVQVTNQLNAFGVAAEQLVDRAKATDHPEETDVAHGYLVETFEFRRDGVRTIAEQLPIVLAAQDNQQQGTEDIAAAMLFLSTSDVIYSTRARSRLREALEAEDLSLALPPESVFLPDLELLQPTVVADRIAAVGGGGGASSEEAAPGLHGNGLVSTSLGGQALTPDAPASLSLAEDLSFEVQVANQGENTETDVNVTVTVGEGDPITLEKALDEIAAGETKAVEIPLTDLPPTGQNVPVTVKVEPVPGEEKTDNNVGEYVVIFTS